MTKELLQKFLTNRCTSEELGQIRKWINDNSLPDKQRTLFYEDWKSFEPDDTPSLSDEKFDSLLDKIHHQINLNNQSPVQEKRKLSPVMSWLTRAAAILLVPVLAFLIYTVSNNTLKSNEFADGVVDSLEIAAPVGSRTVVLLTDGTKVHINSGSKIKYPRKFTGNTRALTLIGEGFFEVAHNPDQPFIVKTPHLNVKALGTKFNVKAYEDDKFVSATLIEGKVVLDKIGNDGNKTTIGAMLPGQHIVYSFETGKIESSKGNVEKYIGWKDGLLIFDNSGIEEVADGLEHMFNVEFEIGDKIKDLTYTVTFVDETLPQILELMKEATPVDYKILPRKKLPNGTYSKQKIVLKKQ